MDLDGVLVRLDSLAGVVRDVLVEIDALTTDVIAMQMELDDSDQTETESIGSTDQEIADEEAFQNALRQQEITELTENALGFIISGLVTITSLEGENTPRPPKPIRIKELERVVIDVDSDGAKHYYVCGIFETAIGDCVISIDSAEVGDDFVSVEHDHWAWDTEWRHRLRELGSDVPLRETAVAV